MTNRVYFTIIDIQKYIPSDEFCWSKAIDLVSSKLSPYFIATTGTYCDDISNFRESYKSEPIYVPVDNCPEASSGQLFMLRDIINNTDCVSDSPLLTKDPVQKQYYSSFNIKLESGVVYGGTNDSIVIPHCNPYENTTENFNINNNLPNNYTLEVNDFRNELEFDDM